MEKGGWGDTHVAQRTKAAIGRRGRTTTNRQEEEDEEDRDDQGEEGEEEDKEDMHERGRRRVLTASIEDKN